MMRQHIYIRRPNSAFGASLPAGVHLDIVHKSVTHAGKLLHGIHE